MWHPMSGTPRGGVPAKGGASVYWQGKGRGVRTVFRSLSGFAAGAAVFAAGVWSGLAQEEGIPLPEHPRPDFRRTEWVNLNGDWAFRFDKANAGLSNGWAAGRAEFPLTIKVPFPWGSALSGVKELRAVRRFCKRSL